MAVHFQLSVMAGSVDTETEQIAAIWREGYNSKVL